MIPCPKCARENDDKALYCDQCRTPVSPEAAGAVLEAPCPACGGAMREVPSTAAACGDCGLTLGEGGPAGQEGGHPEGEPSGPAETQAHDGGEKSPCPVCAVENPAGATQCGGCKLAFKKPRRPLACPKCSEESMDDKCPCGAVLTLSKLLGYVDGSVRVVCSVCKQLFTVDRDECSDCGGATRPADALRELAASGRG